MEVILQQTHQNIYSQMSISAYDVPCEAIRFLQQALNFLENLEEISYKPCYFVFLIHLDGRLYYKNNNGFSTNKVNDGSR